jgi:hypothetical protein
MARDDPIEEAGEERALPKKGTPAGTNSAPGTIKTEI